MHAIKFSVCEIFAERAAGTAGTAAAATLREQDMCGSECVSVACECVCVLCMPGVHVRVLYHHWK